MPAATLTEIGVAVEDLLSIGLPAPKTMDPAQLVANFSKAFEGFTNETITTVVRRIRRGEFPDLNTRFLPTPPDLTRLCAKLEGDNVKSAAFKGYHFPQPEELSPFERMQMQRRRDYADWRLIEQNISLDEFGRNCRQMKYPLGSKWVPMLNGNVYAPPKDTGHSYGNAKGNSEGDARTP